MAVAQELEVSTSVANLIEVLLNCIEGILEREQEAVQAKANKTQNITVFPGLPTDLRWQAMVLGSSMKDYNLWIRRTPNVSYESYTLTEIDTGLEIEGTSPLDVCGAFFRMTT